MSKASRHRILDFDDMTRRNPITETKPFWLCWLVALCLFAVMCGFAAVSDRFPGDLTVARHIQNLDHFHFGPVAAFANNAGDTLWASVITLVLAAVFLALRRFPESLAVIFTFVPRGLRQVLAPLVARPRPSANLLDIRDHASGYSFPSGHSVTVMVLYGALFLLAGALPLPKAARLVFRVACLLMIVATGLARVYVGVHWPSDVLGGFFFGLLALAPIFYLSGRVARRLSNRSPPPFGAKSSEDIAER